METYEHEIQMINLFSGHFKQKDKARQKELDYCLEQNRNHPLIDQVYTFEHRFTYNDFFQNTVNHPNDINILANGDIYFDETLDLIQGIKERECYALTRWEKVDGVSVSFKSRNQYNKQAKPEYSQDVWIFRGSVSGVDGDFHLGRAGCDNRIAALLMSSGYIVTNPSLDIKAIHVHAEQDRNYTMPQRVLPPYKWVYQTSLTQPKQGIYKRL